MKNLVGLSILAVCGILILGILCWGIGTRNRAISLENRFNACVSENKTSMDNMWKTIQQKYQIKNDYAKETQSLMQAAVEGRKGGDLFKMVTESMQGLDPSIYKDLLATIEGKRDQFKRSQDMQISIKNEHDNMRTQFPASLICGSRPEIVLKLVTSSKTEESFETGREDDVKIQ